MHAADIMTSDVITVGPDTPVPELATLLAERGISGVPVIDQGQVVGIVSEGNHPSPWSETGTERRAPAPSLPLVPPTTRKGRLATTSSRTGALSKTS